jgi:NitT/TauT family transport system substrate-binding protein
MYSFQFWLFGILMIWLAACTGQTAAPTPEPDTVNLQMSWIHEYSASPFYAAEKNGHFATQNLSVNLIEGGFQEGKFVDPIQSVLATENSIGMSDTATMLLAHAAGQPVVAIATVTQRSPSVIISLADKNIQTPQDLIGKRVAVAEGGATHLLTTMLTIQNINLDDVTIVPRTDFGIAPLLDGSVDALLGWITNENVMLQEAEREGNILLLSDYGVDTYNFVVFTTEAMLQNKPDTVKRFVTALTAGMADVIAAPDQAIDYTLSYDPALDKAAQLRRLEAFIPLMQIPGQPIGQMSPDIWAFTETVLLDNGLLGAPTAIEDVYRLDFVIAPNE